MKRSLIPTFVVLLVIQPFFKVWAQDENRKHVAIKVNPLSVLLLTGNAKLEAAITNRVSLQLGGYYGGIKTRLGSPEAGNSVRYRQGAIIPEVRFFPLPNQSAPNGLYLAPYFRYRRTEMGLVGSIYDPELLGYVSGSISNTVNTYGGGALVGYQYISYGGFTAEAFIGFSINSSKNRLDIDCDTCDGNEIWDYDFKFGTGGFGVRWGLAIGYAF